MAKSPSKKKTKKGGGSPDKPRSSRRLAKTKKEVSPLKPKAPARKRGRPSTLKTPASKSKDASDDDSDDDSDDESDDESDDGNMIPKEAADALVAQAVQEAVQKNTALLLKKQATEFAKLTKKLKTRDDALERERGLKQELLRKAKKQELQTRDENILPALDKP